MPDNPGRDRKSTRLNSSHRCISYAVFCLLRPLHASTLFPYTTLFRSIAVFGGGRNVFRRLAACGGNTKPPPRGGAWIADHYPALSVKRLRRFRAAVNRNNAACRITRAEIGRAHV